MAREDLYMSNELSYDGTLTRKNIYRTHNLPFERVTAVQVAGEGGYISEIFESWEGTEFPISDTYFRYIGEYIFPVLAPTSLYIRAKSSEGNINVTFRVESNDNVNIGQIILPLTEEYQLFSIPIVVNEEHDPIMIQYMSTALFSVKEIILI